MTHLLNIFKLANKLEYQLFSYAGVQEEKKYLQEKYPDQEMEIDSLPVKYIKWISLRFGSDPSFRETHPLQDCIPTLKKYHAKEAGISQKYNSNLEFKERIDLAFSPDSRGWQNPSDSLKMSVDQMEEILTATAKPSKKEMVKELEQDSYSLPEEDRVGKVGEWNLWLPSSRANSCKIAGYDPKTMEPYTTWCTARTKGSNLFYNYIGMSGGSCILFYIIKDNPISDEDWLSVGFINGTPSLDGVSGGISVNRNNVGLTEKKLKIILGSNYNPIMDILQTKSDALKGVSPAKKTIEEALEDVEKFKSMIRGNSQQEINDTVSYLIENNKINSKSVLLEMVNRVNDEEVLNSIYDKYSYDDVGEQIINKLKPKREGFGLDEYPVYNLSRFGRLLNKESLIKCLEALKYEVIIKQLTSYTVSICSGLFVAMSNKNIDDQCYSIILSFITTMLKEHYTEDTVLSLLLEIINKSNISIENKKHAINIYINHLKYLLNFKRNMDFNDSIQRLLSFKDADVIEACKQSKRKEIIKKIRESKMSENLFSQNPKKYERYDDVDVYLLREDALKEIAKEDRISAQQAAREMEEDLFDKRELRQRAAKVELLDFLCKKASRFYSLAK